MDSISMTILTGATNQVSAALAGAATEAGHVILTSLKRKYDNYSEFDQNFENLEKEARYLSSRKQDVSKVIARDRIIKEPTSECATWLKEVERVTGNVNDMLSRYHEFRNASSGLSQLPTRVKLSREMVEMTKVVTDLKDRMNPEQVILSVKNQVRVGKFPEDINEVPSLCEHLKMLLEFLTDENIRKVGIWGMAGVGKTTILENLNEEVAKLQMFDIVLWVTVTKKDTLVQIQQTLLKQLTLNADVFDAGEQGPGFISRALENKKYLVILDEVFSEIDLRRVGIHDGHKNGKVVVATRERIICHLMDMDEDIKVERMSRTDARKLFHGIVGRVVEHPNFEAIAERILIQCGELPQIIRAVGSYLKGKLNEDFWQSTLSKLQSPNLRQLKHMEDVFTTFHLIYEELHGCLKECLLYAASFPEDHEIYKDYLVECWKAEQLIGIGQSLRKACEEGHANLEDLIDKCLFDRCKGMKCVKMPTVFRNAAVRMAQLQNFGLLDCNDEDSERPPSVEKWSNARVISLMYSGLSELPDNPESPRVSSLLLQKNENLSVIPASFFEQMSTLKILDLYGTNIKVLPPSVLKLINLRALYLNDCQKLLNLPNEVRELQNLEVLDISRSGICGLPLVIAELTRLQCLRISFSSSFGYQNCIRINGMEAVLPKMFERLVKLEELAIDVDPRDSDWYKIAPAVAAKLANLEKLSALSFYFPDLESLQVFTQASISWKKGTLQGHNSFRSFNVYVGSHEAINSSQLDVWECSGRRYLQYSCGTGVPDAIKEVLTRACAFKLLGHEDIKCFSDFDLKRMKCLEMCVVEGCSTLKTFISCNLADTPVLPWLRELQLLNLHRLENINQGLISQGSFAQLTTLTLYDCRKLLQAISWEMAKVLIELQHLRVQNCSQVTEVIEINGQFVGTSVCPKLKILELINLEELTKIHDNELLKWHALQRIEVIECDRLTNFCLDSENASKLRSIRCTKVWWESVRLTNEVKEHLFPSCFFVEDE